MNIQIYVGVIFRLFVWVLFLQYRCGFVCRLVSSWRLRPKMLQRLLRVQLEPINEAEAWPKFTMMQYNNSIVFLLFSFKIFLVLNFMRFLSSCWWRVCSFINNLNQAKILFTFIWLPIFVYAIGIWDQFYMAFPEKDSILSDFFFDSYFIKELKRIDS